MTNVYIYIRFIYKIEKVVVIAYLRSEYLHNNFFGLNICKIKSRRLERFVPNKAEPVFKDHEVAGNSLLLTKSYSSQDFCYSL